MNNITFLHDNTRLTTGLVFFLNLDVDEAAHLGNFSYARDVGVVSERFDVGAAVPRLYELGNIDQIVLFDFYGGVVRAVPLGALRGGLPSLFFRSAGSRAGRRGRESREREGRESVVTHKGPGGCARGEIVKAEAGFCGIHICVSRSYLEMSALVPRKRAQQQRFQQQQQQPRCRTDK